MALEIKKKIWNMNYYVTATERLLIIFSEL